MGYSGRYHAASLVAVFVALAVGILIGVGLGSDVISGTAKDLEDSLGSDLDEKRQQVADLEAQLDEQGQFGRLTYPALVDGRLRGQEIAIVALGDIDDQLTGEIRSALTAADATLSEVAVVREPPDSDALAGVVRGGGRNGLSREEAFERAATASGRQLVRGGDRFNELRPTLLTRFSGEPGGVDGVVVVRDQPDDMSPRESDQTDALESGLIAGMRETGATVVGAERSDADPSSIAFFDENQLPTVDNVDQLPGRVALVYILGGTEGDYGVKETADGLLPDLLTPASQQAAESRR